METLTRWQVVRAVSWRPWVGIVNVLWVLYGVLDAVDSKIIAGLPATSGFRRLWDQYYILPSLWWEIWTVVAMGMIAVAAVEGAYRFAARSAPTCASMVRRNAAITALHRLNQEEQLIPREVVIHGSADAPELYRTLATSSHPPER